uniref:Uncharacterized protein n=1 Tax=Leersia perrieri TaxID=77586 RepID=A0A0D9XH11_9ORYZ
MEEADFNMGSSTVQTSDCRSGRFFLLISQHLRPTRANCSACIRGHSPADESNIACKQPFSTARCTSFKRPNPDLPVKRRRSMIPKEYTSERGVRSPEIAYSGSMYTKEPFGWVHFLVCNQLLLSQLANRNPGSDWE